MYQLCSDHVEKRGAEHEKQSAPRMRNTSVRKTLGGDAEPAEALREAATEETAEVAESAPRRARRRGRMTITSEDVAQANERHQDREERGRRRERPITETSPQALHSN